MKNFTKLFLSLALMLMALPNVVCAADIAVGGICYNINSDGVSVSVVPSDTKYSGDVVIPSQVMWNNVEYSVTTIGDQAFRDCKDLTSITLPNSVTSIGFGAFYGCKSLTSIEIPKGVTYVDDDVFWGCKSLTSVYWNAENCYSVGNHLFFYCPIEQFIFGSSVNVIPSYCCSGIKLARVEINVEINNGVTSIGDYAFRGCLVTSIEIPSSVSSIGNHAFEDCSGLTYVKIPNSVTSIGSYAFSGCTGLTSIEISNSVTSIGQSVFSGCSGLTSLEIPNSVTSIGAAFYGCTGLTSISIPNSVTSIGQSAFSGCTGLTSISIPNSVTSIGSKAFYRCTGLTSIEIPNSITSLGDAFYECSGLTSISIPNSVTSIGQYAFRGCTSLTSIEIPNSVTSIGGSAFYGCTGLTSISMSNSVTSIEGYAFCGCTSLTTMEIPNSVTSIGENVFGDCNSLSSVMWNAENCLSVVSDVFGDCPIERFTFGESLKAIPVRCCYNMTNLTIVEISNGVASIGAEAFMGCSGLTSIEIPNSVTSIGKNAFKGCSSLSSVVWNAEDCSSVGYGVFGDCPVERFTFGKSLKTIPVRCCYNMRNLTAVEIPNSVMFIEGYAFCGCTSLTTISIPNSVTSIGQYAFSGCTGLTSIEIPNSVTSIGGSAFYGCTGLTSISMSNSVTSIEGYTFCGCTSLTTMEIPNSVTSIGSHAFEGCSGLTSIELPNGVTSIGANAFMDCIGLTSIVIPKNVTSVGERVFSGCSGLTSVLWNAENCTSVGVDAFKYCPVEEFKFGDSVVTIPEKCCYGISNLMSVEIPNGVTSIGANAFMDCIGLTSIVIPKNVTSVGERVFSGCSGLTSVVWNAENCTSVGVDAFKDCLVEDFKFGDSVMTIPEKCCYGMKNLTSVEIPNSVISIGESAFSGCTSMTSIEIPKSVTSIGSSTFGYCTNLKSIKILNGNATIGNNNLTNCKGLTYIEAPASLIDVAEADLGNVTNLVETLIVTGGEVNEKGFKFIYNQRKTLKCLDLSGASNKEIADEAFLDLYKTRFIFMPEGTTSIGYKSFSGCVSLMFARIPSSVTDIEYNAFNDCVGLEYIYCSAETPPTVVSAFTNVDKEIPVYVPCGKVDLYKKAKGWKEFENILCIDEAKQSEEVVAEPTAEPEETSVQLTWAVEHTAGKYVVTVMQGDEVVSILTFDPKGALIDYSTGSSRSASGLRSADAYANSFVYTVRGLSEDTEYTYSVEVFDYDGVEIEKYVDQFKTLGGEVAVDENKFGENVSIKDAVSVFNKTVSVNGYEPPDIRVYNTVGQPVSNPVPASGVYVVKIGGEAVKVMVK